MVSDAARRTLQGARKRTGVSEGARRKLAKLVPSSGPVTQVTGLATGNDVKAAIGDAIAHWPRGGNPWWFQIYDIGIHVPPDNTGLLITRVTVNVWPGVEVTERRSIAG